MSSYIKKDNDKLGQLGNTLYKIMFSSFQDGVAIINLNNKL